MENENKEEIKDQPQENIFDKASALYDRIKAENDRAEAIQKRNEELAARNLLGGKSDASIQPEPVKEIEGTEYIKKIQQGFRLGV